MEQRSTQNKTSSVYFSIGGDKNVTIVQGSGSYYYDLIPVEANHDYYLAYRSMGSASAMRLRIITIAENTLSTNVTVLEKFTNYQYAYGSYTFYPAFYFHTTQSGYLWIYTGEAYLNFNFEDVTGYDTHISTKYWSYLYGNAYLNPSSSGIGSSNYTTYSFLFKGYPTTYNSNSYGDDYPYQGLAYASNYSYNMGVTALVQTGTNRVAIGSYGYRYYSTPIPGRLIIADEWNNTSSFFLFMNTTLCYIRGKYKIKQTPDNLSFNYGVKQSYVPLNCSITYNNTEHIAKGLMLGTFQYNETYPYYFRYMPSNNTSVTLLEYASGTAYPTKPNGDFTIDFGELGQEVPLGWYLYLMSQLEEVYENQYTFKSVDGTETLYESTADLPPLKSITLSCVGSQVYFQGTGINENTYNFTWSHTDIEGKVFSGLAYVPNSNTPSIPIGTSVVDINTSTTLYEVWNVYKPPARTFDINLYQYSGEPTRVDKSSLLTSIAVVSGALRGECSIIRPTIDLQFEDNYVPICNYIYIAKFERYYFIRNITSIRQKIWRIECEVDPLMTYLSGILALNAYIARQEFDYNDELVDNQLPCEKQSEILVIDPSSGYDTGTFNNQLEDGAHNFVLTVVGA